MEKFKLRFWFSKEKFTIAEAVALWCFKDPHQVFNQEKSNYLKYIDQDPENLWEDKIRKELMSSDLNFIFPENEEPNYFNTYIEPYEFIQWLNHKQYPLGLFEYYNMGQPIEEKVPFYIDSQNENYCGEIHAAISLVKELANNPKLKTNHQKQKWLKNHLHLFGLPDEENGSTTKRIAIMSNPTKSKKYKKTPHLISN